MKKPNLPLLIAAALLVTACNVPVQPAPAVTTAVADTASVEQMASVDATELVEGAETPVVGDETAPAPVGIPVEALKNATYSGIYDEPITLIDGLFESQPAGDDPAHPIVEYIDDAELTGDLDGDGIDDAVVFLAEGTGGSGVFIYIAAQLNSKGQPVDVGAVRIEDRIGVKSAVVEDGQIMLEIITQGLGDAACCSTHKASKTYALQDVQLAETTPAGGKMVQVSAADLDGTNWSLLELADGQSASVSADATLNFAEGQVSGSGGCNSFTGSFSLGDNNPLVMAVGPLAATERACPDPVGSQESVYFVALNNVAHWGYEFGKLALYYGDGENSENRLLFAPQSSLSGAGS